MLNRSRYLYPLILVFFTGLIGQPAKAASSSEIIDGFSEFLIARANANLVAVYERRLKDDKNFQCYFPGTYEKIDSISLENLFNSRNYWENSLAADLEVLIYRAILVEAQQGLKILDRNQVIEALQNLEYEYEGKQYPLNVVMLDWPKPLRDQVNGFSFELANALDAIDEQRIFENVCQVRGKNKDELKTLIEPYLRAGEHLVIWSDHIARFGKNLRLPETGKRDLYCRLSGIDAADCTRARLDESGLLARILNTNDIEGVKRAARIAQRINEAYNALDALYERQLDAIDQVVLLLPLLETPSFPKGEIGRIQDLLWEAREMSREERKRAIVDIIVTIKRRAVADDPDTVRIADMLRALVEDKQSYTDRALVALELLDESVQFDPASFERLSKGVMFFVSIADAEDKDAVKNVLEAYTLPAVSFGEKRKLGTGFFISSYLGLSAADTRVHGSMEGKSNGGLFVPVGIEYNRGFAGGDSLSIMLSPIDMAYPVNLKLSGVEQNVDFDEIIAPSITVAYGFKDYPLNVGIGYQRGRRLADVGKTEERFLLFVTFDLPLFRLY